jgi:hypothetical protein
MPFVKKITDAIKSAVGTLSPNCRDASRLQSEALDKKLSFAKRVGLRLHLLICKWCRRYGKQIRFLRSAAQQCPDHLTEAIPQNLSAEAKERIRERLQAGK